MEIIRAIGLEDAVKAQASPRETMASQVVATAFSGTELGRVWSWGNDPGRQSEYLTASPTVGCDIPQNRLEPILLAEAARLGVLIRFQNTFTGIDQDDDGVTVRVVAEHYGKGRVFLAGDAAHRHPPTNGLGANTCIQDGFNLAWKLAYVLTGKAGPGLLETYSAERQPIGERIVNRAIDSWKLGADLLPSLGLDPSLSYEERAAQFAQLGEATDAGERRRRAVSEVLEEESYIFAAHGVEMNQVYASDAVVQDGTELVYERDEQLYIQPTSHPGARIPHAWVGDATRTVSTLDVVGSERFTLLTRDRGQDWVEAARTVASEFGLEFGVDLAAVAIGHAGDMQDLYGDFARRSEIGETGCLLVRPDQHIALRRTGQAEAPSAVLREAFAQILDRDSEAQSVLAGAF